MNTKAIFDPRNPRIETEQSVDTALNATDDQAATTTIRYSHDKVFGLARERMRHKKREAPSL